MPEPWSRRRGESLKHWFTLTTSWGCQCVRILLNSVAVKSSRHAQYHFHKMTYLFLLLWLDRPQWAETTTLLRFRDYTQNTPQLVGLLCTSDLSLCLITHNTHMTPRRFEPAIPASEGPQNHVLDRVATGAGCDNSHPYTTYILWLRPLGCNIIEPCR